MMFREIGMVRSPSWTDSDVRGRNLAKWKRMSQRLRMALAVARTPGKPVSKTVLSS